MPDAFVFKDYFLTDEEMKKERNYVLTSLVNPRRAARFDAGMVELVKRFFSVPGVLPRSSCTGHFPEDGRVIKQGLKWYITFAVTEEGASNIKCFYSDLMLSFLEDDDRPKEKFWPFMETAVVINPAGSAENPGGLTRPWLQLSLCIRNPSYSHMRDWHAYVSDALGKFIKEEGFNAGPAPEQWRIYEEKGRDLDRRDTIRRLLVKAALGGRTVTYSDLIDKTELKNKDGQTQALIESDLDHILIGATHTPGAPLLTSLAVDDKTHRPKDHFWVALLQHAAKQVYDLGFDQSTPTSEVLEGLQKNTMAFFQSKENLNHPFLRYVRTEVLKETNNAL